MTTLWYDLEGDNLDEEDEAEEQEKLLPADENYNDVLDDLIDLEEEDIYCRECGALVDDGIQCSICGLVVGI